MIDRRHGRQWMILAAVLFASACRDEDTECYHVRDDRKNCGGCGNVCALDDVCHEDRCVADRNWALWPLPELPLTTEQYDVREHTVIDRTTLLEWQNEAVTRVPYAGAEGYCAKLSLDGGGWRLPTRIELVSIDDFTKRLPSINTEVFPDTATASFKHQRFPRRCNVYDTFETPSDVIDFTEGTTIYHNSDGTSESWALEPYVRCVRDDRPWGPSMPRYDIGVSTVLDVYTGLRWQKDILQCDNSHECPPKNLIRHYEDASDYCEQLSLDGYDDFRVPSVLELYSITYPLDQIGTQIDPRAFPDEDGDISATFYSSTTYARSGDPARPIRWVLNFVGKADAEWDLGARRVRCVRNER